MAAHTHKPKRKAGKRKAGKTFDDVFGIKAPSHGSHISPAIEHLPLGLLNRLPRAAQKQLLHINS